MGPTLALVFLTSLSAALRYDGWTEHLDDPSMGAVGRYRPAMRITAWNSGLWYVAARGGRVLPAPYSRASYSSRFLLFALPTISASYSSHSLLVTF